MLAQTIVFVTEFFSRAIKQVQFIACNELEAMQLQFLPTAAPTTRILGTAVPSGVGFFEIYEIYL